MSYTTDLMRSMQRSRMKALKKMNRSSAAGPGAQRRPAEQSNMTAPAEQSNMTTVVTTTHWRLI